VRSLGLDTDTAPVLRMVPYAFEQAFGGPPTGVWHAPGGLVLLTDGGAAAVPDGHGNGGGGRGGGGGGGGGAALSVAMRWGAIVAARPRHDDAIELASMNWPGERVEVPLAGLTADGGDRSGRPAWADGAIRAAAALQAAPPDTLRVAPAQQRVIGASMLIQADLPESISLASPAAVAAACVLALACVSGLDLAPAAAARILPGFGTAGAAALLGRRATALVTGAGGAVTDRVPFDLARAGLRLLLIDTGAPPGTVGGSGGLDRPVAVPEVAAPRITGPEITGPEITGPQVAGPQVAGPQVAGPQARPGRVAAAVDSLRVDGPAGLGPYLAGGSPGPSGGQEAAARAARAAGAFGARAAAGRPGLVVALAPLVALPPVRDAVSRALADQDGQRPRFLTTVAVDGAHRAVLPRTTPATCGRPSQRPQAAAQYTGALHRRGT
jgi:galactokinase